MGCCVELVVITERAPVTVLDHPAALLGRQRAVDVTAILSEPAVILLDHPTPVIGTGGIVETGGGGTGNLNEVFKVVFLNTGDVALRGDGTIVTARV